ncbi:MAG: DNA processing protein DprA [Acidimicrobiales bacterium mtb01]|nr:DNA-processing protein DprA [Actinomycetota bacterium]TEX44825.1 MAG: DNA processing protein DprA [Acidimicrobiales bacterium mtb01]
MNDHPRDHSADHIAVTRLLGLPALGPRRLRALLRERRPTEIEHDLRRGRRVSNDSTDLHEAWTKALAGGPSDREIASRLATMRVAILGDIDYPESLAVDPAAPAALFSRGDVTVIDRYRRVAMVGTRRATEYGRGAAHDFGRYLASHGVAVVSGLALGIDAAAHRGSLAARTVVNSSARTPPGAAPPIGVVASGLDVVYPRLNSRLWSDVAERGVLVSESPPGTEPDRFRFPLRNRIIAALAEVLVVVESRATGGSMLTVNEALQRDVPVMSVPGATRSLASEGTNLLLRDGALVAASPDDVLTVLGLTPTRHDAVRELRPVPMGVDRDVLAVMGSDPMGLDDVVRASAPHSLGAVALALGRLEAMGWVMCTDGWFELANPSSAHSVP